MHATPQHSNATTMLASMTSVTEVAHRGPANSVIHMHATPQHSNATTMLAALKTMNRTHASGSPDRSLSFVGGWSRRCAALRVEPCASRRLLLRFLGGVPTPSGWKYLFVFPSS